MASAAPNARQTVPNVSTNVTAAYIPLLGSFTGDIWHVAAAQILWEHKVSTDSRNFPFPNFRPVTAITVPNASKGKTSVYYRRGQQSYNYLKAIGLPCTLMALPDLKGTNMELIAHSLLTSQRLDQLRSTPAGTPATPAAGDFDQIIQAQLKKLGPMAKTSTSGPTKDNRLIPLWASTSIVMQLVKYIGVKESQAILGTRLCNGITGADTAAAHKKIANLETVIKAALAGTKFKRVVLFNYRIGDVNKQHNSNPQLLQMVTTLATANQTAVVCVAAMPDAKTLDTNLPAKTNPYVFDLYGVKDPNPVPFQDKRVTVQFWRFVAESLQLPSGQASAAAPGTAGTIPPCVLGLVGGRSGSMDLPAFVGVNCLSWDEPLFEQTAARGGGRAFSPAVINTQMPQLLRLINEGPLMGVGFLDHASKPVAPASGKDTSRTGYRGFTVNAAWEQWFKGPGAVIVNHPLSDNDAYEMSMMAKYVPMIEKVSLGIQAVNVRAYYQARFKAALPMTPPTVDVDAMEIEDDEEGDQ